MSGVVNRLTCHYSSFLLFLPDESQSAPLSPTIVNRLGRVMIRPTKMTRNKPSTREGSENDEELTCMSSHVLPQSKSLLGLIVIKSPFRFPDWCYCLIKEQLLCVYAITL